MTDQTKPTGEDLREDDFEYDPSVEPKQRRRG